MVSLAGPFIIVKLICQAYVYRLSSSGNFNLTNFIEVSFKSNGSCNTFLKVGILPTLQMK
jgi:hypothetical protein